MPRVPFALPLVILAAAVAPGAAQDAGASGTSHTAQAALRAYPAAAGGATFRSGIDLVALTVTVTDTHRRFVGNLTAADFQVFEDGVQQPVSFFGLADVPLDVALLVDASASMEPSLPLVRDAAAGLLATLRPQDRASLVEFRNTVRVTAPMTADRATVIEAVRSLTASGGTALHNALYVALKDFQAQARTDPHVRRRAIVVLSDGEDTGSLVTFDEVLDLARRSGVAIYTVALRSNLQAFRQRAQVNGRRYFSQADYAMRMLADETGAQAFFPGSSAELKSVYTAVAAELAAQYALGYVSRNPVRNGAWRRLVVRVAESPGTRPRTRAGYFAEAR